MSNKQNDLFEEQVQETWEQYLVDLINKNGIQSAIQADRRAKDLEDKCQILGIEYV